MKNVCKNLAIILSLVLLNTAAVAIEQNNQLAQQDLIYDKSVFAREYSNIGILS
ncbi:tetratricopeptide repeat with 9 trp repeats domain protein [Orientia tsutsugamushi str. Gilliam]|uniref:Tetratricopeptide repeat with 9 trp repeats domain protein n=1 Tax=Orientia tsutsugamushi str. Gilliam TaxID=1359184 RepID=A0A0F3MB15_ORITS|nr:hypothetical protein [Orientia tsutsugamushi]KJV52831.1 tetratricopeptide repeat with 9 trp repeats domain protein [Orientia tsutsugamushi str. Gilliam]